MTDFLVRVAVETWYILKEASIFLLFGFALAGVLAVLVHGSTLRNLFGRGKVRSVMWASAIGIPLPLCSCGVLPTALGLRREGATKGATVSFLISTPETGVDSISLTYALMDPIITVFRPLAAMITAVSAGLATNFFGEPRSGRRGDHSHQASQPEAECLEPDHQDDCGHDHGHEQVTAGREQQRPVDALDATRRIYRYAFRELLDDTSHWLGLGIVLSGIIAAVLPPTFFEQYLGGGFTSMLVMLVIGIPIYTCASASTPIAAAFVLKGLNPGAALVFLLAGPATNIGSLVVLLKFLGVRVVAIYTCASASTPIAAAFVLKGLNPGAALVFLLAGPATNIGSLVVLLKFLGVRVVAIYLSAIVIVTLAAGFALNWVYAAWAIDPAATFGAGTAFIPEPVKIGGALLLLALLLMSMRRTRVPGEWLWLRDRFAALSGLRLTGKGLAWASVAAALALYFWTGVYTVQPGEVGVRLRFGEILAPDLAPGLHVRLPWPLESHRIIETDLVRRTELGFRSGQASDLSGQALARERMTVGGPSNPVPNTIKATGFWFQKEAVPEESFLLTGDGNLVDLRFTVQYRVTDPVAYAYRLAQPDELVRSLTLAALRGVVATGGIDQLYTDQRGAVEDRVMATVQERLDAYGAGIEMVTVRLLYVHPPEEVHGAFRDVASAQEDKLRTINRARTFAVEKVNQAEGEAAAMIESALAFKDEQVLKAQGEAAGFALQAEAYRDAPELTTFRLQLETIEEVLPGTQKFVRPAERDIDDFDLWLLQPLGARGGN